MTIDILIPAAGSGEFVRQALEGLQNQDYSKFRVFILDNACEHETYKQVVEEFKDNRFIYRKFEKRLPMTLNWQRCLESVENDWFGFLHDDDIWAPSYLSEAIQYIRSDTDMVLTPFCRFRDTNTPTPCCHVPHETMIRWGEFQNSSPLHQQIKMALAPIAHMSSAIFRRKPIGFDCLLSWNSDQAFAQEYARQGEIAIAKEVGANIREHHQSITSSFSSATASRQTIQLLRRNLIYLIRSFGDEACIAICEEAIKEAPSACFRILQATCQWPIEFELRNLERHLIRNESFRGRLSEYGRVGVIFSRMPGIGWCAGSTIIDALYLHRSNSCRVLGRSHLKEAK